MKKIVAGILTGLMGFVVPSFADTLSLVPEIQGRKQACFISPFNGYISQFDGREFEVYVVLVGCGRDRRPPARCHHFVVPKDRAPAALSASVGDEGAVLLRYRTDEREIVSVHFDDVIGQTCQRQDLVPMPKRSVPNVVWVNPTQYVHTAMLTPADAKSLGVQGEVLGAEWFIEINPGSKAEPPRFGWLNEHILMSRLAWQIGRASCRERVYVLV